MICNERKEQERISIPSKSFDSPDHVPHPHQLQGSPSLIFHHWKRLWACEIKIVSVLMFEMHGWAAAGECVRLHPEIWIWKQNNIRGDAVGSAGNWKNQYRSCSTFFCPRSTTNACRVCRGMQIKKVRLSVRACAPGACILPPNFKSQLITTHVNVINMYARGGTGSGSILLQRVL